MFLWAGYPFMKSLLDKPTMRITKLLSLDSEPAKPILDRATPIALTFIERIKLPSAFVVGDQTIENALGEVRPLEVGDVLVDENGGFYKIEAPVEKIFKVTGDLNLMQEAVYALTARGVRVAQTEDGFAVAGIEQYKAMLESVGLTVTAADEPFMPVPLPRPHHGGCGCGCGGHHHHHGDGECGCGCGGHHHHDDEGCGCGCGGHHHDDEECGCGCGGHHHHDDEECGCGCGGHHHHDDEECGCGCGGHHHHDDKECGCGGHHHAEGECCCQDKRDEK